MKKYRKKQTIWIMLLLIATFGQGSYAAQKVLVIVDSAAFNNYIGQWVLTYVNDIVAFDHKKAQYIIWGQQTGTDVQQCLPLWTRLQTEYSSAKDSGDNLEGAVLIGNIPVPQIAPATGYLPLDQVYMDIVDSSSRQPYLKSPFDTTNANGYYTTTYSGGDQYYDIWISRIDAAFLNGLRQGSNDYDEYVIYANYLNRVHNRMTTPANVPSRGFAMGGPENLTSLHTNLGQYMQQLNLPWLAEFSGGENSSFNWMSQLLAGPRGCINWGAFNGTLFPDERNRRYCRYTQLNTVYVPGNPYPTQPSLDLGDSLGWEWAGLYGHSCPEHTNFYSRDNANDPVDFLNGTFSYGTPGQFWGSNYRISSGGIKGGYYWYQDNASNPNPYNYSLGWGFKMAEWRWPVSTSNDYTYNVYIYYSAINGDASKNCATVTGNVYEVSLDANGVPLHVLSRVPYSINQQTNTDTWVQIASNFPANHNEMAIVSINANADGYVYPGNYITDAVRFQSTDAGNTVNDTVDDAEPSNYHDSINVPWLLFSKKGFIRDDEEVRGFEDMGDEPGGNGFSKSQFFFNVGCSINDFTNNWNNSSYISKNIGNLYALGHNGLISMGAASSDLPDLDRSYFATALNSGKDFGGAFLDFHNAHFYSPQYALLGAGSLYARPYIQYGSDIEQYRTITTTEHLSLNSPILIQNVTVTSSGNWFVTSTSNSLSHSEIVIRPECDFAPTGANVVDIKAN